MEVLIKSNEINVIENKMSTMNLNDDFLKKQTI